MGRQDHQGGPLTVRFNGARSLRFLVVGLVAPSIAALALATQPISAAAMAATAAALTVSTCDEAHLEAAVTQANSDNAGDTVRFTCSGDIILTSTLTITGSMTLDGSGQSVTLDGGNSVEVLRVNGGATFILDALTVAHGSAAVGGGLYNDGTVSISNSTFANNSTHNPAGSSFSGGGGLYNHGTMSISNSTFDHNVVDFGDGGGLSNGGTVSISNSSFDYNVINVDGYGAGLYNGGTVSISNSTVANNSSDSAGGGGLWSDSGMVSISKSTFTGNSAHFDGGLYSGGTTSISKSTFTGNAADDVAIGLSTASISNSTIAGNISNGPVVGVGGTVSISNSTIADNHSGYDLGTLSGTGSIKGSIVANNSGGNCRGSFTDEGYNLESGTDCGFTGTGSLQNTDPKLVASGLQSNGGPTPTIRLAPDSPAIDRIPAASCPATDQRGVTRPDAGEVACDIGAYESTQISDLVSLVNGFHLATGLQTALDAKLNDALAAETAGQTAIACGDLTDFINQVKAQTGKQITTSQATQLIGEARQLKAMLAC
jgi:fibronectin-binding autotransporter adhesin